MGIDPKKSWEVQSSTGKHFDVLDGIRGVAILMVVAYHIIYTNAGSGQIASVIGNVIGAGWLGVPVFFVLSGFLISYPFFRQRAINNKVWYLNGYTLRRVGKILPPYYLSILIFATFYYFTSSNGAYLYAALQWALGIPNFYQTFIPFNASYWSLIVEVHFYVILPLLFFLTRGRRPHHTTVFLFCILFLVPMVVRQITWPDALASKDTIVFLMSRFPCQLDYFAWGVLFAGAYVSFSKLANEMRSLSIFGYIGIVLLSLSIYAWAFWSDLFHLRDQPTRWSIEFFHLVPGISAFLLLFFIFDPLCLGSRALSFPPLRFVGIVSYEWFLFHQPIAHIFKNIFGQANGSFTRYICKTGLPIILSFGLAVALYRYFSLPLMDLIRDKSSTRK